MNQNYLPLFEGRLMYFIFDKLFYPVFCFGQRLYLITDSLKCILDFPGNPLPSGFLFLAFPALRLFFFALFFLLLLRIRLFFFYSFPLPGIILFSSAFLLFRFSCTVLRSSRDFFILFVLFRILSRMYIRTFSLLRLLF